MEDWRKTYRLLFSIGLLLLVVACADNKTKPTEEQDLGEQSAKSIASEGYELMKMQCYACHNPESPSHDEILAPPLAAVKMRYQMQYKSEEAFVTAVVKWTVDPQESKALMRGAVDKFKVMPKQLFKAAEIQKIATYIFNNKLEEPAWFDAHQKEMHANGRMGGMGNKPIEN